LSRKLEKPALLHYQGKQVRPPPTLRP